MPTRFPRQITLLAVTLTLLPLTRASGQENFRARLQNAASAKDNKQEQAVLEEWKRAHPDDVEYYIAAANRLYNHNRGNVVISTKKAQGGDFVVSDKKNGNPVGSISASAPSPEDLKEAITLLLKALEIAPARMDVYLGVATLYEEAGDPGAVLKSLGRMAAYAKAHTRELLYKDGAPYPQPPEPPLSLAINNFANRYFQRPGKENDRTFHDLAQLDADAFPDQEYGHNLLGVYYTAIDKQPKLALTSFERALQIVPDDSLVWINVGLLHARSGDKAKAAAAFKKVVDLHNDDSCVEQAKAELARLR